MHASGRVAMVVGDAVPVEGGAVVGGDAAGEVVHCVDAVVGCDAGGIVALGQLVAEYPVELNADLRELFGVGFDASLPELWRLSRALMSDPRSRVAARMSKWKHPVSLEWMALAAVHDVIIGTSGVKDPEKHHFPRPWPKQGQRVGGSKRTRAEALKILRPDKS